MASRKLRFQANLLPTTPLRVLEMHYLVQAKPSPIEEEHGGWLPLDAFPDLFGAGSMSSLVGYIPRDGGDLLTYLKDVRRIVEAPENASQSRIDDALSRMRQIESLPRMRTYSPGPDFQLRPNETLEDYANKVFKKPHAMLDFVLDAVYGASYKSLDKEEKAVAKAAGSASLQDTIGAKLASQCDALGWRLNKMRATSLGAGRWRSPNGTEGRAEQVVLSMICRPGESGSFCEGESIKVLMKAACFPLLVKHNLFGDPDDAACRYFEAQCTILIDRRAEILGAIRASSSTTVEAALSKILSVAPTGASKQTLDAEFLMKLYAILGADRLANIAEIFVKRPYDYRAGWPDLTLIGPQGIRLVEVKTTDRFHDSQVRFAREVAAPLGLQCEIVQLAP